MTIGDKGASYLRTLVPTLWGALITQLVVWWPSAPDVVTDLANNEGVLAALTAGVIFVWYWAWRKIENRIPAWLTRIVLGSNQVPVYVNGDDLSGVNQPESNKALE